jgi:hypothetical protein
MTVACGADASALIADELSIKVEVSPVLLSTVGGKLEGKSPDISSSEAHRAPSDDARLAADASCVG